MDAHGPRAYGTLQYGHAERTHARVAPDPAETARHAGRPLPEPLMKQMRRIVTIRNQVCGRVMTMSVLAMSLIIPPMMSTTAHSSV